MNPTLLRAARTLAAANRELLDFSMQLQHRCWEDWQPEAAAHMLHISEQVMAANEMIMLSEFTPPTPAIQ